MVAGVKRIRLRIHGRVQGVGYRYFVQRLAHRQRLAGYVRNEADGSVRVEAQGPEDILREFLADLKGGPSLASVREVTVDWLPPGPDSSESFDIRF